MFSLYYHKLGQRCAAESCCERLYFTCLSFKLCFKLLFVCQIPHGVNAQTGFILKKRVREHQGAPSDQETLCCVRWNREAVGTLMKEQAGAKSQAMLTLCINYKRKGEE